MGGVPSKPGDPSRPLEVIGAGFSKTGTLSMQLALQELLQGPVIHGGTQSVFPGDEFVEKYCQAYEAKAKGDRATMLRVLREITTGYAAVTDLPNTDFVPELLELYPDAKVVLVTRDPLKWWDSFEATLSYCELWFLPGLTAPVVGLRWFPKMLKLWRRNLERMLEDEKIEIGPGIIETHNEMIRKAVPPARLLEVRLEELQWDPLCQFLGKAVPNQLFPRVNEAAAINKVARRVFGRCLMAWVGWLSMPITAAFLAMRLARL